MDRAQIVQQRHSLLWRIHLWAAIIASPFVIGAILTGLLFVFTPQIESFLYRNIDRVTPAGEPHALDEVINTAKKSAPDGWRLHSVIPAYTLNDSIKVAFVPPATNRVQPVDAGGQQDHAGHELNPAKPRAGGQAGEARLMNSASADHAADAPHEAPPTAAQQSKNSGFLRGSFGLPKNSLVLYVDPYRNTVLGSLPEAQRFNVWARRLHSSYLTEGFRWTIELAASWTLVMLVTGIFLWWPSAHNPLTSGRSLKGRGQWQHWHAWTGVVFSVISASIIVTGLTWSRNAGEQVRSVRDALGQQSPRIPATFKSIVPSNLSSSVRMGETMTSSGMLSWQGAWEAVKANSPDVAVQIMAPVGREGFWRSNHIDRGDPTKRFDLLLDAYNGKLLYFSGWDDQPLFGKATAIGIPFHRGEFGVWNQVLLALFGFGLLFSFISGWIMFFKRRRKGLLGLPVLLPGAWRNAAPWAYPLGAFMLFMMPLLALSSCAVLAVEGLLLIKSKRALQ